MLQSLILLVDCFRADTTLGVECCTFLVETDWSNNNDETTATRSLCTPGEFASLILFWSSWSELHNFNNVLYCMYPCVVYVCGILCVPCVWLKCRMD